MEISKNQKVQLNIFILKNPGDVNRMQKDLKSNNK